ncbi:MAG: anthranilate phosphoribosyltransferase [Proteobacteria bacterium]|nr:MAG: anthranilate phosphoribosyltransferase [Pseudomonadota bacterium]
MTDYTFSPAQAEMRSLIQRVATGPELSKDLSRAEAFAGMRQILNHDADPVQAAIYLIALRMKRETDEENAGVLDALVAAVHHADADLDDLVDMADPYDGFVRGTPASTFLPPVLAALGVPTLVTGAEAVGPKYGVTHHMILRQAGIDVFARPDDVARQLESGRVGWGYLDQSRFIPSLHGLLGLRTQMVKRTVITTLEVLLRPVHARRTHLMTGYVHKPYPPRYLRLARQAGYASAMIVRGVEGGVIPSLIQPSKYHRFAGDGGDVEVRVLPEDMGVEQTVRIAPLPDDAEHREPEGQPYAGINANAVAAEAARRGEAALKGEHGPFRDSLVMGASICLTHLGRCESFEEAASQVRGVLDRGAALERFEAARG